MLNFPHYHDLPNVYGFKAVDATFKSKPSDFVVAEHLHYELTGEGEHLYLYIEKEALNTQDVKSKVSKHLGVPLRVISEAGLKDKHAITRQWISVQWPIKQELPDLNFESFKVLDVRRHIKKLKRGAFGYNQFQITLRDIQAPHSDIDHILQQIKDHGYPNYFGPQRFGYNNSNLENALKLFGGQSLKRHARSLAISAARSFIFNQMLAAIIQRDGWPIQHLKYGILWGQAKAEVREELADIAQSLRCQYTQLCSGLENNRVEQSLRILSVVPKDLDWHWIDENTLKIEFSLPPGCYATALLREIFNLEE